MNAMLLLVMTTCMPGDVPVVTAAPASAPSMSSASGSCATGSCGMGCGADCGCCCDCCGCDDCCESSGGFIGWLKGLCHHNDCCDCSCDCCTSCGCDSCAGGSCANGSCGGVTAPATMGAITGPEKISPPKGTGSEPSRKMPFEPPLR